MRNDHEDLCKVDFPALPNAWILIVKNMLEETCLLQDSLLPSPPKQMALTGQSANLSSASRYISELTISRASVLSRNIGSDYNVNIRSALFLFIDPQASRSRSFPYQTLYALFARHIITNLSIMLDALISLLFFRYIIDIRSQKWRFRTKALM